MTLSERSPRALRLPPFARLVGRLPAHRPASRRQEAVAGALIGLYVLASVLSVWVWVVDPVGFARWTTFAFTTLNIPLTASFVSVAVLFLVTGALVRRKRLALLAVFAFQILGSLVSVAAVAARLARSESIPVASEGALLHSRGGMGLGVEAVSLLVSLGLVAVAWWLRPAFPACTARASWWRSALVVVVGYGLTLVTVSLLIRAQHEWIGDAHPVRRVVGAAMREALGFYLPRDQAVLETLGAIPLVAELILGATVVLAVWLFLRSVRPDGEWDGQTEVHVRELLARHGEVDSLGYFATRRAASPWPSNGSAIPPTAAARSSPPTTPTAGRWGCSPSSPGAAPGSPSTSCGAPRTRRAASPSSSWPGSWTPRRTAGSAGSPSTSR